MQVLDTCEVEKFSQWKRFFTNFDKNCKSHHFTFNGHGNFKLSAKVRFLW